MKAWIAIDKNNKVFIFFNKKPWKVEEFGFWTNGGIHHAISRCCLPKNINPKWEDDMPIKINLKMTLSK